MDRRRDGRHGRLRSAGRLAGGSRSELLARRGLAVASRSSSDVARVPPLVPSIASKRLRPPRWLCRPEAARAGRRWPEHTATGQPTPVVTRSHDDDDTDNPAWTSNPDGTGWTRDYDDATLTSAAPHMTDLLRHHAPDR
jgi:hypothetical protein